MAVFILYLKFTTRVGGFGDKSPTPNYLNSYSQLLVMMKTLGFIGAGNMARALMVSVLSKKLYKPNQIVVSAKSTDRLSKLIKELGVKAAKSNQEVVEKSDIIFLCMKPQDLEAAMKGVKHHDKLFVSILAGVTLQNLMRLVGKKVIRVMPNMNCVVGQGAGPWCSSSAVTQTQKKAVLAILECGGTYVEFNEDSFDTLTAFLGCGPAFLSYFLDAMIEWGVSQGISPKVALELGVQTMVGTGILLRQKKITPAQLITLSASKKGVTLQGLDSLEQQGAKKMVHSMLSAAKKRSEELSQWMK